MIRQLNPVLRGWANYHRHAVAKKTFVRVDSGIWSMLWQWAARRHPNKGTHWVKKKYFKAQGFRNWIFAATEEKEEGTRRELILLQESDTPIQRHIKIKADANPHDPKWEAYFESRWGEKTRCSKRGRRRLYRVWLRQDGICPACREPITKSTSWDVRRIVKKSDGGSDAACNLQLYHLNCHRNSYYARNAVV